MTSVSQRQRQLDVNAPSWDPVVVLAVAMSCIVQCASVGAVADRNRLLPHVRAEINVYSGRAVVIFTAPAMLYAVYAMALCLSVSVCLSVWHKSVFY